MLVNNGGGLPQGDTDNPELIAQPRGGTPSVIDTQKDLEAATRALSAGSSPIALDVERAQGFRYGSDPYLVQIRLASSAGSVSGWRPSPSRYLASASSRITRRRIGQCVPCRRSGCATPPLTLNC